MDGLTPVIDLTSDSEKDEPRRPAVDLTRSAVICAPSDSHPVETSDVLAEQKLQESDDGDSEDEEDEGERVGSTEGERWGSDSLYDEILLGQEEEFENDDEGLSLLYPLVSTRVSMLTPASPL